MSSTLHSVPVLTGQRVPQVSHITGYYVTLAEIRDSVVLGAEIAGYPALHLRLVGLSGRDHYRHGEDQVPTTIDPVTKNRIKTFCLQ